MKKLLTFLTLLTLFFTTAWAGDFTYDLNKTSPGSWSTSGNTITVTTTDGVVLTIVKGSNGSVDNILQNAHIRLYGGTTFTITPPSGEQITNVAFYHAGSSYKGTLKVGTTNLTNESSYGSYGAQTWAGTSSDPLVVTASDQCRVNKLVITTSGGSGSNVATPVITLNPATGPYYVGDEVTASITCGTEGATLTYSLDNGSTWQPYSSAVTITSTSAGDVTITAKAAKDGDEKTASKTVTFVNPPTTFNNLANVNGSDDNTEFTYTAQTVVLGKSYKNMYIVMPDNSAGTLVNASSNWSDDYSFGKIINPNWSGKKETWYTKPRVVNPEDFSLDGQSAQLTPIPVSSDDDLTLANYGRYAVMENVTVDGSGNISGITTTYNQFGLSFTDFEEGKYDVYGVVGWHNSAGQFMPLKYVEHVFPIHNITYGEIENGAFDTDGGKPTEAAEESTVTIKTIPAAGYELKTLTVTPSDNTVTAPTVTIDGNNATFTMPACDVTVNATFAKAQYLILTNVQPNAGGEIWVQTGTETPEGRMAEMGTTIQIQVVRNNGYKLKSLTIKDANGTDIESTEGSTQWIDNREVKTYYFSMPGNEPTIYAVFEASCDNLFILGTANENQWDGNKGVQMTYSSETNCFTADVYFSGASGQFSFTEKLSGQDGSWSNMGKRYGAPSQDYSLNGQTGTWTDNNQDDPNRFYVTPGLYTISVNWGTGVVSATPIHPDFFFTPEAGAVESETPVSATSNLYSLLHAMNSNVQESNVITQVSLDDNEYGASVTITGNSTVTAKSTYGNIAEKATADYTIQEAPAADEYELVTNAGSLNAGDEVIITNSKSNGNYLVMAADRGDNRGSTTETINNSKITLSDGSTAQKIILESTTVDVDGQTVDAWMFNVGDSKYLYAASSEKNYLRTADAITVGNNGKATITMGTNGNAVIIFRGTYTRNIIRNNGNLFSCYGPTNTQADVYLFKKASNVPKAQTPVISPADGEHVVGGILTGIEITAGQGATVYYTTDGTDPSTSESRVLYEGAFEINSPNGAPKTVMAIAYEDNVAPSSVAVATYYFDAPAVPTFNPNANVVQSGDFQVTISCEDITSENGGKIYYMVVVPDPQTDPESAADVIAANQIYSGPITVTGDGKHKVYAVAELNGLTSWSNITYTTIQTSTEPGDWTLVTSASDIVEGRQYFIVNNERERVVENKMKNNRFTSISRVDNVVYGPNFSTATVTGKDVAIFTFEIEEGNKYMKNAYSSTYYWPETDGTDIKTNKQAVDISDGTDDLAGFVLIRPESGSDRCFAYNSSGNSQYFGSYLQVSPTGNNRPIYMYYREVTTLAQIEASGTLNQKYNVADALVAVDYREVGSDVLVWCKDDNGATKITPADGVIDFMQPTNAYWDQSNWVVLKFTGAGTADFGPIDLPGNQVKNIVGKYSDDNNYTIDVISYAIGDAAPYTPNTYCVANFNPTYIANGGIVPLNDNTYFFMTPKVQEICKIKYAEWNSGTKTFQVPTSSGFKGSLNMNWAYNEFADANETQAKVEATLTTNNVPDANNKLPTYEFEVIVQRQATSGGSTTTAPSLKGSIDSAPVVYPMNLTSSTPPVTAISTVKIGNGEVKSVKYVNVAGIVSDTPFQGVNIVVTEYTDGSRTTTKMLKR